MSYLVIRFRCPCCQARIKASHTLCGYKQSCPACRNVIRVPHTSPQENRPQFILQENEERFTLGFLSETSYPAEPTGWHM